MRRTEQGQILHTVRQTETVNIQTGTGLSSEVYHLGAQPLFEKKAPVHGIKKRK